MDSNNLPNNKIQFIISFGLSIKKLPWARDIDQLVWEVLCSIPVTQEEKEINLYVKDDKSEMHSNIGIHLWQLKMCILTVTTRDVESL